MTGVGLDPLPQRTSYRDQAPPCHEEKEKEKDNDAFVDNCGRTVSKRRKKFHKSERATRKHLEEGTHILSDLFSVTGGAIVFHKCGWQILAFDDSQFSPNLR